jgi:hypothetical protein
MPKSETITDAIAFTLLVAIGLSCLGYFVDFVTFHRLVWINSGLGVAMFALLAFEHFFMSDS